MIEINLIPDVKQELIRAQRMRGAVISGSIVASIIAGSVVALLLIYVLIVQNARSGYLDGQIKNGADSLSKVEDLSKILTIQNQLTKISDINQGKSLDSRVFDMLSAVTPGGANTVQFSEITVDNQEGTIKLEGQTAGYGTMEVFKKTVASAVIEHTQNEEKTTTNLASDISISDVGFGENAAGEKVVRFILTFKYAPELFSLNTVAPVFKLSVNGNVTDSYVGIPKSIFTERAKDL